MSESSRRPSPPSPSATASPAPSTPPSAGQEGQDRGWLWRVWLLVAVFAAVALARSAQVGIGFKDPGGEILRSRIALSLAIFLGLVLLDAAVRTPRPGWSVRAAWSTLRERWTGRRLSLALGGLLAYHCVYFCYHNLKSWDVFRAPRDRMLESWDHWLFLGHSPAVLLHDLLGQHVAAYVLMVVYESFPTLASVSFVAALALAPRIKEGYVFIASMLWVWILGVGSYYLVPSLGPFDAAPGDFSGLPRTMIQDTQARYLAQRDHLLAHPHAADAFAQISAFASLHVAVTTATLLMARYYGLRRTTRALTVFLVGTVLATIYLGWHFAVDDLAGLVIAFVSVRLGRWMIHPPRRADGRLTTPVVPLRSASDRPGPARGPARV